MCRTLTPLGAREVYAVFTFIRNEFFLYFQNATEYKTSCCKPEHVHTVQNETTSEFIVIF
jgi:hypothetical protein